MRAGGDATTELLRHRLHAVANAEHRHAELEHRLRRRRPLRVGDRLRTAGENDALGAEVTNFGIGDVPRQDLAVNAAFAHAASDQLSVLRTEIENQNAMRMNIRARQGIS
jgi:hypothetical protein